MCEASRINLDILYGKSYVKKILMISLVLMSRILLIPTNIHDAKTNPCSALNSTATGGNGGDGGDAGGGNGGSADTNLLSNSYTDNSGHHGSVVPQVEAVVLMNLTPGELVDLREMVVLVELVDLSEMLEMRELVQAVQVK